MKKILCAVTACLILITGCSNADAGRTVNLPDEISAEVQITHNASQYSARLTQRQGYINLIYSSPKYLDGLSLTRDENGSTAELLGLKVTAANCFSDNSAICVLQKILTAAKKSSAELSNERSGEAMIFSGETDGMKFQIKTDLQAQSIYEISVPDKGFTFTFN